MSLCLVTLAPSTLILNWWCPKSNIGPSACKAMQKPILGPSSVTRVGQVGRVTGPIIIGVHIRDESKHRLPAHSPFVGRWVQRCFPVPLRAVQPWAVFRELQTRLVVSREQPEAYSMFAVCQARGRPSFFPPCLGCCFPCYGTARAQAHACTQRLWCIHGYVEERPWARGG